MSANLLRTVTVLPVNDISNAAAWYKSALDFETVYLHEGQEEGETTNYAVLEREGLQVHLVLDEPPPHDLPWTKSGTGFLYLIVKDIDAMLREVESRGVQLARGLKTEDWGARGFYMHDPCGNTIHIEGQQ